MSVAETHYQSVLTPALPSLPVLSEMPKLLEYRSDADPDAEFIPKTVAGFALGTMALFISLGLLDVFFLQHGLSRAAQLQEFVTYFAYMFGITAVASSLLLVGLKVRADHWDVQLYCKHWLNSIATGSVYALMFGVPLSLMNHSVTINRFMAAAIFMTLLAFPAVAAKWTVGPHPEHERPA